MFRGRNRRRGRWGGNRGRGNFKRYGNRNQQQQQQQQQPQQQQQQQQQMYMPQSAMTYGSSGYFNGMDGLSYIGNDAMDNRDMRFSTDDYMEPFKTDMAQMTSFQSAPMQQMPTARGKKKNRQKRQREDSQSSNGMLHPTPMPMLNTPMAFSRPNKPPFMTPMGPFQMPMQHAGMVRFAAPFAGLSTVKRMKMDEEMPLPPGQGMSKKALRRKRLRMKQKLEQEAKKGDEEETTKTDDVEDKEEVAKKPEDASPKKERKFRRKPFFGKWEQKPFQCHYCRTDTQSYEGLEEHIKTPEHELAIKEKEQRTKMSIAMIYERNEQRVQALMMMGKMPKFCSMCMLKYCGPIGNHKSGRDHQSMMRFLGKYCVSCEMQFSGVSHMDKHNISTSHIRNSINRLIMNGKLPEEDLNVEEYDPEKPIGRNYVVDMRIHYCQPCDLYMKMGDTDILEHCKSKEHFDKFREFAEVRKVVEEERKKREKEAAEEEERKKEEEVLKAVELDDVGVQENSSDVDLDQAEEEAMEQEAEEAAAAE